LAYPLGLTYGEGTGNGAAELTKDRGRIGMPVRVMYGNRCGRVWCRTRHFNLWARPVELLESFCRRSLGERCFWSV